MSDRLFYALAAAIAVALIAAALVWPPRAGQAPDAARPPAAEAQP